MPVGVFQTVSMVVPTMVAVLRRPDLWRTAIRQAGVLARPGWWRRAPFLPLPDAGYLHFRFVTMYGGDPTDQHDRRTLAPADLITYLEWCRAWPLVIASH